MPRLRTSLLLTLCLLVGLLTPGWALELRGFPSSPSFFTVTMPGQAAPAVSPSAQGRIYFDSGTNTFKVSENAGAYVNLVGSGAPTSATYITQTAHGDLSAEQALSALSTGLMNVATTTGVITSIANVAAGQVLTSGTPAAWSASPTLTTSLTSPLIIGGTGTTSTLILRPTSGVGATGADIIFQVGNNGADEVMRILNNRTVRIVSPQSGSGSSAGGQFAIRGTASGQSISIIFTDGVNSNGWFGYDDSSIAANRQFWWSTTDGTSKSLILTQAGNFGLMTSTFGTSAVGVFAQGIGTAPTTSPADVVQEWVADCAGAGTACKNWRDEGGNVFSIGNNQILVPSAGDHGWSSRTVLRAAADGAFSVNTNAGTARFQTTSGAAAVGTQVRTAQATAPTCTTNCGTTPSVSGSDTAMVVTLGTGAPASPVTVTFNGTWATAPACNAANRTTAANSVSRVDSTTTTAVIYFLGGPAASDLVALTCLGVS